jgi:diguanylate cyclase (GGDEF)-like protein
MTRSVAVPGIARRLTGHRLRTILFWAMPSALATALWVFGRPGVDSLGSMTDLTIIFVLFMAAERTSIRVEIQRQTWGITASEIPYVIGLFLLPPLGLLAARTVATASLMVDGRRMRGKQVFNTGSVAVDVWVAVATFHGLLHGTAADVTMPRNWLIAFAAISCALLANSGLIALAISITAGKVDRAQIVSLLVQTLAVGAVNTTIGLAVLVLLNVTPWAAVLLGVTSLVFAAWYRAYGRFLRQHRNLGRVYEFSRYVERARSDRAMFGDALEYAREILNASAAQLWIHPTNGAGEAVVVTVEADAPVRTTVGPADDTDPIRAAAMSSRRSRRFLARDLTDARMRAALTRRDVQESMITALRTGEQVLGTLELTDRQGQLASFSEDDLRLLDSIATHLTSAIENQQLLDRLRHAAYHDRLTELPNRGRLAQAIDEAIGAADGGSLVVLCQLDIDRFKEVNDSLGHAWGDQLLARLGERLRATVPREALVARVGADEFAVLTTAPDAATAEQQATVLREAVSRPYALAGLTIDVAVAVGVALAPEHAADADALMRRVDIALSNAKNTGRPVALYHQTMDQESLRRLRLVTELRQALDNGQVVVRYQPKVALRTRELIGVEALVRWNHPEYGQVRPDDFVGLAEVTGLIGPLTMHVLRTSLQQVRRWLDRDLRIGVAVNLSARTLVDVTFPDRVAELLREFRVPAEMLTFELTESTVMSDPERMKPVLHRLHEFGVGLSIDDFGIGYSSMAQLRRLPVDEVKIDKEFVLSMGTDLGDLAIVRAIIELGHSLGLRVVAEGVEDELARDLLVGNDCDVIQGYLVSRALDPDRLDAWLTARTTARPAQPGVPGRRVQMVG